VCGGRNGISFPVFGGDGDNDNDSDSDKDKDSDRNGLDILQDFKTSTSDVKGKREFQTQEAPHPRSSRSAILQRSQFYRTL